MGRRGGWRGRLPPPVPAVHDGGRCGAGACRQRQGNGGSPPRRAGGAPSASLEQGWRSPAHTLPVPILHHSVSTPRPRRRRSRSPHPHCCRCRCRRHRCRCCRRLPLPRPPVLGLCLLQGAPTPGLHTSRQPRGRGSWGRTDWARATGRQPPGAQWGPRHALRSQWSGTAGAPQSYAGPPHGRAADGRPHLVPGWWGG